MIPTIAALLLAAGTGALAAPPAGADPLHSRECLAARTGLEQVLAEPAGAGAAHAQRLARARREAAAVCLGRDSPDRERSGAPDPVQAVPAPVISGRPAQPPQAAAPPQPPLSIPRPAAITACDPAGCWDSEGRRLNHMGPLIVGPRGLCTLQGGQLNCP